VQLSASQLQAILDQPFTDSKVKVFWLEGKEMLLIQDVRDKIRRWANKAISNRQLHHIDHQFNWQPLLAENASFGLFDEDKIYDLRLTKTSLKAGDIEQILEFVHLLDEQKCVIISSDKIEKKTTQLKIFKSLSQTIATVTFWPLSAQEYPRWIQQYSIKNRLQLQPDTVLWLSAQHEGNLLALKQCLDRLCFTAREHNSPLGVEDIRSSTLFQAKYTTFDVVDIALQGQSLKALQALRQLQAENAEPILVLWALHNGLEALDSYRLRQQQKQSMPWPQYKIFGPRIRLFEKASQKLKPAQIDRALQFAGSIDQMIKGLVKYNIWHGLEILTLMIAQPNLSYIQQFPNIDL